jgi:hypothetical protein
MKRLEAIKHPYASIEKYNNNNNNNNNNYPRALWHIPLRFPSDPTTPPPSCRRRHLPIVSKVGGQ